MRQWIAIAMLLAGVGCADLEANALQQQGQIRIEPHPADPAAYRVSIIATPEINALSPIDRNSEAGHRDIIVRLLGERCANAAIIREGEIEMAPLPLAGRRLMYILKVACPTV